MSNQQSKHTYQNAKRLGIKKEAELINKMWEGIEARDYEYIRKRVYIGEENYSATRGQTPEKKSMNTEERDKMAKEIWIHTLVHGGYCAVNDKISLFEA